MGGGRERCPGGGPGGGPGVGKLWSLQLRQLIQWILSDLTLRADQLGRKGIRHMGWHTRGQKARGWEKNDGPYGAGKLRDYLDSSNSL